MAKWRNLGGVESGGVSTSYTDQDGAYMDYDAAGGYVQFGAKKSAAGSLGLKLRTILAGAVLTVLTFTSAGNATFVGQVTMGALAATSGAFVANSATISMSPATGTSSSYLTGSNTGGSVFLGVESSTGGSILSGSAAYDVVLKTNAAKAILIATNNTLALTIASNQAVIATQSFWAPDPSVTANQGFFWNSRGGISRNATFDYTFGTNSLATAMMLTDAGDLILNQGANDGEILTFRSSDVAHGMTALTTTDTYGYLSKQHVALGGVALRGLSEDVLAILLEGYSTSENATRSVSASASIFINAGLKSGASAVALNADKNLVAFGNFGTVRFILDTDGDSHQDVGTAWTNFDSHDDVALLNLMAAHVTRRNDPLRRSFGQWLGRNRADLELLKLVTFNDDGHHFVNMSRLTMLHTGAIRQIGSRQQQLEAALRKVIDVNPQLVGRDAVLALLDHSTN